MNADSQIDIESLQGFLAGMPAASYEGLTLHTTLKELALHRVSLEAMGITLPPPRHAAVWGLRPSAIPPCRV